MFKEFRKLDIFYHNGISLSNILKRIHKNPGKQWFLKKFKQLEKNMPMSSQ